MLCMYEKLQQIVGAINDQNGTQDDDIINRRYI